MRESELAPPVERYLRERGYRVWVDPDGSDFFDVIARKGEEIGLIELKLTDYRKVFHQALRRRGFGDWVAVVLPTVRRAEKVLALPAPSLGEKVGVWVASSSGLLVMRPAVPLREPGDPGPFPQQRRELTLLLDALEAGRLAPGIAWEFAARAPRGRRSTREFRIEEFDA